MSGNLLHEWLPYIIVGAVPSVLNLITSLELFSNECRQLPLFCYWKHGGSFLWCIVQLSCPFAAYWFMFSIDKKPLIDGVFWLKAGLFGIGFFGFVNTSPQLGPITIPIKSWYTALIKIPMLWILNDEAGRTTDFWEYLRIELNTVNDDFISKGIKYLESYVDTNSAFNRTLNDEERIKLAEEHKGLIAVAKKKGTKDTKAAAIVNVFKQVMRSNDLPRGFVAFGCQNTLSRYYPSWSP